MTMSCLCNNMFIYIYIYICVCVCVCVCVCIYIYDLDLFCISRSLMEPSVDNLNMNKTINYHTHKQKYSACVGSVSHLVSNTMPK